MKRIVIHVFILLLLSIAATAYGEDQRPRNAGGSSSPFIGNWALKLPNGAAGWLTLSQPDGKWHGELWTVGGGKRLSNIAADGATLKFTRRHRVGDPEYVGGPQTDKPVNTNYTATVKDDIIKLVMHRPLADGKSQDVAFSGKRTPPLPPKPDLSKIKFGKPINLFNGRNLDGWMLTNPEQINGWKAINGELVNTTDKLDFSAFSRYGNLRTKQTFYDFNLKIEFRVPPGGNSGIYLRGVYEAQVLDRDSRMQGIQGVGAIFGRIKPTENAGKLSGEWNTYDITLVDRHATVILNGKKVIDNQPIPGCTNGALFADETIPGPLYLQGDHTAVSYRNIVLTPIVKQRHPKIAVMETAFKKRADATSFKDAKEAGYNAMQMHSGVPAGFAKKPIDPKSSLDIATDPSVLKSWQAASKEHGVKIISLCAGSLNKCQIWARDREAAMRITKQTIDACHMLDVNIMLFPFFGPSNFQESDEAFKGVADFMKDLLPYAKAKNVVIGIEAPVTTVRVMALLKKLNYPVHLKVYYDTGNLYKKEDIYETIRKYGKDHFCEVHIKASDSAVIGKGNIDLAKLAQALDAAEYNQWLVYEANRNGRDPVANRKGIEMIYSLRKSGK